MSIESVIEKVIKIFYYICVILLLGYIVFKLNFIIKQLPNNCANVKKFDVNKTYVASYDIPKSLQSAMKLSNMKGSISGKQTAIGKGTFDIKMQTTDDKGKVSSITTYSGQLYVYDEPNCSLTFTLTDEVIGYLQKYKVDLSPYVAHLVPNEGIRLNGTLLTWFNLSVIGYPGTPLN